jgi:plastocyanin
MVVTISLLMFIIFGPSAANASPVIWPVTITPGASTKSDDAYDPDELPDVSTIDFVEWFNLDSQPHTVTSGISPVPDGKFDSLLIPPGETFRQSFSQPGKYPYFCTLHPNMVGLIVVHRGSLPPLPPIGGEILNVEINSLFIAGVWTNADWIVSVAGLTAAVIVCFVLRKRIKS